MEQHTTFTLQDLIRFATHDPNRLTRYHVLSFVDRLDAFFTSAYHNPNARAEATSLRALAQNLQWKTLIPYLQFYADPKSALPCSRTHYWRHIYLLHLSDCHRPEPEQLDLATALNRLANSTRNAYNNNNNNNGNNNGNRNRNNNNQNRNNNGRNNNNGNRNRNRNNGNTNNYNNNSNNRSGNNNQRNNNNGFNNQRNGNNNNNTNQRNNNFPNQRNNNN